MSITWTTKEYSVANFYSMLNPISENRIDCDPVGQRPDVESMTKRQGIIDTVLRGYDFGELKLRAIPNTDITGLGTASTKDAGSPLGVATLDAGGKVPVSELPAAVLGALSYQGTWNASTNTPTLTSSTGTKGYYYVVSVAGNTNLDGITDWLVGDWAVYNGTVWQKVDNTETVTSVNG